MAEIIDFLSYLERKRAATTVLKTEIYFDQDELVWKAERGNDLWVSDSYEELMFLLGWEDIEDDIDIDLDEGDMAYEI